MSSYSSRLPILPLPPSIILLPSARITIPVSRKFADALLARLDESETLPVVAAIPIISSENSTEPPEYSEWGTAARVIRIVKPPLRSPRNPYVVSLHGLTRVRLAKPFDVNQPEKDFPVEYPSSDDLPSRETIDKFKESALAMLDRLARDTAQQGRRDGYRKVAEMLDDIADQRAAWMADVLVASLNGEHADKLAILSTPDPESRLKLATALFIKHASIFEVSRKISSAVDESLSKQQKEFFLRQQLAAIQRELQSLNSGPGDRKGGSSELDDDEQHEADDLADLKSRIEAMAPGSEERKMGVREWRRLKRIPQGSVENGVIRSYLEWLTAVPWPNSTSAESAPNALTSRAFLAGARAQLDADHFGLEKIKKRLIEYLAVVRLKEMNAVAESKAIEGEDVKAIEDAKATDDAKAAKDGASDEKALVPYKPAAALPKEPSKSKPRRSVKGPILLFVGPPGTGKTSLGQSVAKALGRPFQRIALGGVRDEAEIRGHRRTYVASGPGLIVQALRKAGRPDPVILLDEIDKIGQSNFHGDPGAALLEVLDPEQNHTFNDHYINVPIDLSQVLFICTSNTLDTISAPLLDRCEVIQLSGYTYDEKMHIARKFLLPKQLTANGLDASHVSIAEPALLHIATQYTREAGVRSLERAIGAVVRYKAVEWAEYVDERADGAPTREYKRTVEESELEKILGLSRWDGEECEREARRGVVYGLVVMGQGEGGILPVEAVAVPGSGGLKLTGSLGDVIKESAELALTWVKTHAYDLCITGTRAQDALKVPHPVDVHLHLPAGATKKDGPSAGVAMTCAFVSLLTGACVPAHIAMTGEITLRGRVTPVGGIKEKVLGAHRAQMTKLILPWGNRKDVEHDVALDVRGAIEFVFVRTVREALEAAFGPGALAWRRDAVVLESRL